MFPADTNQLSQAEIDAAIEAIPSVIAREQALQAKYPDLRDSGPMYGYSATEKRWEHGDFFTFRVKNLRASGALAQDEPKLP